jgi:PAS domain S-box-containing protein
MEKDCLTSLAFQYAPIGILMSEHRGIADYNDRFQETFGYGHRDLRGQSLELLYPSVQDFDHIGDTLPDKMKTSGRHWDERLMKRASGELFWCRVRGQTLSPGAPFEKAIWTFADLSEVRPTITLTERERQVAARLAEGLTAKEIARVLGISHRTVETHRAKLLVKMKAKNSLELVARLAGFPF